MPQSNSIPHFTSYPLCLLTCSHLVTCLHVTYWHCYPLTMAHSTHSTRPSLVSREAGLSRVSPHSPWQATLNHWRARSLTVSDCTARGTSWTARLRRRAACPGRPGPAPAGRSLPWSPAWLGRNRGGSLCLWWQGRCAGRLGGTTGTQLISPWRDVR